MKIRFRYLRGIVASAGLLLSIITRAAPGDPDLSFNPGSGIDDTVTAMALQPDGKVIVGGDFSTVRGVARARIARLNTDGSGDATFDPGNGPNAEVRAVALQNDGKILIGGAFTAVNGVGPAGVARLNADGSVDLTFQPGADARQTPAVTAIAVQSDGKIVIGGGFSSWNGVVRNGVARLNADGGLDTSFVPELGQKCVFCSATVEIIAIQPDGKVLVGGGFTTAGGTDRTGIARLNPDGKFDSSFNAGSGVGGGSIFSGVEVLALALQTDGKAVVGGSFTTVNGTVRNHLARFNADGTLDTTFDPGTGPNGDVRSISAQADGALIVAGAFTGVKNLSRAGLARISSTGTPDPAFASGAGASGTVRTVVVRADGEVLVGGEFLTFNGGPYHGLVQLNPDSSIDAKSAPVSGPDNDILALALQSDGKIVIGGRFTFVGPTSRNRIARLNADGTLDTSFDPGTGANNAVQAVAIQPDGKILMGGLFTLVNGTIKSRVARLNTDGSLEASFTPATAIGVNAMALQPDGELVIAGNGVARLNANGTLDSTFTSAAGNGQIYGMSLQNDGKILLAGAFDRIARLNTNGTLDTNFTAPTGLDLDAYAIVPQPDGKILVGGAFQNTPGKRLARLNSDGTKDPTFDVGQGGNGIIYAIAVQPDGKVLIAGNSDLFNGVPRKGIARLNSDGSVDTSFNLGSGPSGELHSILLQPDGKAVVAGTFTGFSGMAAWRVSRLTNERGPKSGGTLTNGLTQSGTILQGDADTWRFTASALDSVDLKLAANGFGARLDLYGPGGALVSSTTNVIGNSGELRLQSQVATPGSYTLLVNSQRPQDSGTYALSFAQIPRAFVVAPHDEGGSLADHIAVRGSVFPGDLDSWTFPVSTADPINLEISELNGDTTFSSQMDLYGPDGTHIGSARQFSEPSAALTNLTLARGTYTVVVSSGAGGSGAYQLLLDRQDVLPLPLGSSVTNDIGRSGDGIYYVVNLPPGGHLDLNLDVLNNLGAFELYARRGQLPTSGEYDFRFSNPGGADQDIFVPDADAGPWYVLVESASIPGPSTYVLRADFSTNGVIRSINPNRLAKNGPARILINAAGFGSSPDAVLSSGATILARGNVTMLAKGEFTADFDLSAVPLGNYQITMSAAGNSASVPFEIIQGDAHLQARIIAPARISRSAPATFYIEYANTGAAAIPAPLLLLHGTNQTKLSLDTGHAAAGFWSASPPAGFGDTVQMIAGGQTPGILQPGERVQVPVIYAGMQPPSVLAPRLPFQLAAFDDTSNQPIDWTTLKAAARPDYLTDLAWDAIWNNFVSAVGPTWADYNAMLAKNATYLGNLGLNVPDASDLLRFQLLQADGLTPNPILSSVTDAYVRQPGTDIIFSRFYPAAISQRLRLGPLGWGWSHNWEYRCDVTTNQTVVISGPLGSRRVFLTDVRGGFFNQPGDYGKLTSLDAGRFQLLESDGTKIAFRSDGLLDSLTDLNGNQITAGYSGSLLTKLTHSSGESLEFTYNGPLIESVQESSGSVTTYGYDSQQNLVTATYYDSIPVSYGYSSAPGAQQYALTSIAASDGTSENFTYDTQGRLASISRNSGSELTSFSYDSAGTVFASDAASTNAFYFNQAGLISKIENDQKNAVRATYDANLNLVSFEQADGKSFAYTFDSQGNRIRSIDPMGSSIQKVYSNNSRVTRLTDPLGRSTGFTFDPAGNLSSILHPDGTVQTYGYDAQGQIITRTNRRGQTIAFTFDASARLTRKSFGDGRVVDFAYDTIGNLTNVNDSALGTTALQYDARRLLTGITWADGRSLQFEYDAQGRRTQRTSSDGYTIKYFYNTLGRLERLEDGMGRQIVEYAYDIEGRPVRETKGNGTWSAWDFDKVNRSLTLVNHAPDGTVISQFTSVFDVNGNRLSTAELGGTKRYSYDSAARLTAATYPNGRTFEYSYDAAGNRTTTSDTGTNATWLINSLNEYLTAGAVNFSYDPDGNIATRTDSNGTTTYTYDSENNLTRVATPSGGEWDYTYDAFGNRVEATHDGTTTHYFYDPRGVGDLVAEYDSAGSLIARYDHALSVISRLDVSGRAAYYDFDPLGNCREMTGDGGSVLNRYEYEPFGAFLRADEQVPNPFCYVGRFGVMSEANGLNFMRQRFFAPDIGRFISPDPNLFGDPLANRYTYAGNNPLSVVDPRGDLPLVVFVPEALAVIGEGIIEGAAVVARVAIPIAERYALPIARQALARAGTALEGAGDWLAEQSLKALDELEEGLVAARNWVREDIRKGLDSELLHHAHDFAEAIERAEKFQKMISDLEDKMGTYRLGPRFPDVVTKFLKARFPERPQDDVTTTNVFSVDPNELIGPAGMGDANYLTGNSTFGYRINFQNATNASAPAQVVLITNTLSTNLDLATLIFTSIGFGDYYFTIPPGSQHYEHTETVSYNGVAFDVNIEARLAYGTRQVLVRFESLTEDTGLPPTADAGFLPPEDGTGRGNGHVAYTVDPLPGLLDGTEIRNVAFVTFDPLAGGPTYRTDLSDPHDPSSPPSAARQALVTIGTPPQNGSNSLRVTAATSQSIQMEFTGAPGEVWTIQRAPTVLGPWDQLQTVTISPSGTVSFQDVPSLRAVFYRAVR